jgi:nicotinate phosphoribosyltransferase
MKSYKHMLAEGILYTDQYQLTMAQLYYYMGLHEIPASFDHFFRSYPNYGIHEAGYCINAGLEWLVDWMKKARFDKHELTLLANQKGRSGAPIYRKGFLDWLRKMGNFDAISLCAIPEGRVVHPNIPLTIVQGPLAIAQILETSLLNHLNFQTLIASKAARIREIGRGQLVLEFGLRRAQDRGALAGTRAALIGGADYSSNVGISYELGFPPQGTHAHSMIQVFTALGETELDAFRAYAEIYPDDCLLLVDTIDTLESGLPNAIKVFEELRNKGHQPIGIRLDSGDLAFLSIQAVKMLDKAGFPNTTIVLSNQLDELVIWQIITQIQEEAPRYGMEADIIINRLAYGVGTKLITSGSASALDGVYKLVAIQKEGKWIPTIKISESRSKTSNPGFKRTWRLYDKRLKATADLLTLETEDPRNYESICLHHPTDATKFRTLHKEEISKIELLHIDIISKGELVYEIPTIAEMRQQRQQDIDQLDPGVKRLMTPHIYHISLSDKLWNLKQGLVTFLEEDLNSHSN